VIAPGFADCGQGLGFSSSVLKATINNFNVTGLATFAVWGPRTGIRDLQNTYTHRFMKRERCKPALNWGPSDPWPPCGLLFPVDSVQWFVITSTRRRHVRHCGCIPRSAHFQCQWQINSWFQTAAVQALDRASFNHVCLSAALGATLAM